MRELQLRPDPLQIFRRIESFFFPPLCILCDAPRLSDNRWFCHSCSEAINELITNRQACSRCGQNRALRLCSCEYTWDYPFEKIIAFVDYTDIIQDIMRHIKYHGKCSLAYDLGLLCSSLTETDFMAAFDMIIPIPLHKKRALQRGYNQAEYFARGLTAGTAIHPEVQTTLLLRKRNTISQTTLDKSQRKDNLKNAFILSGNAKQILHDKSVLLVDDVITTGATTATATEVLLEGGCRNVMVLSFARD